MKLKPRAYRPCPGDWVDGIDPIGQRQTGMYWRDPFGIDHHEQFGDYLGQAQIVGLDGIVRGVEYRSVKPAKTPDADKIRGLLEKFGTGRF